MKNKISELEIIKKIRRIWTRDPTTKIIPSKKIYNRKKKIKEEEE